MINIFGGRQNVVVPSKIGWPLGIFPGYSTQLIIFTHDMSVYFRKTRKKRRKKEEKKRVSDDELTF